ncbi:hypothetical protein N3K66_004573 [Trichothecium roseum]|uniref:Uncharacterized protein n=1 Tax=Trichothecium roseum TaxID=47278 RepID=A0ACC0V2E0_9HYPO|nr:hypothetical protein N3K66_004573 [Trichothecium roseum]
MSYGQYEQNPYQQGPSQESGYGYGQSNPYAQDGQGQGQYEMQNLTSGVGGGTNGGYRRPLSKDEFLDRVKSLREEIKNLTSDIDYIGQLHQRSLGSTDASAGAQLEQYVSETQVRNTAIKDGIKGLERDLVNTTDSTRNTKDTQLQSLKTFFRAELDKYQSLERDYQQRYREQIARQYRIVNPDATEEEVREATEADWGNEGVFQTALRTNRTGHASSVLGNVRARHNELQRIERTLHELMKLYEDLAAVVEQQDPVIQATEQNAELTNEHIEKGNDQVATATHHVRNKRKLQWWCALVVFLILVALGVGLGIGLKNAK